MTNKIVLAYLVYLPVALGLTLYVARTLFRNARVFMLDIFRGKEDIADSTNKLFEVGFYLVNMGFALKILEINNTVETNQQLVEQLASKVGGFAIYLGVMLFLNLYLFFRGRRKSRENRPLPPTGNVIVEPTY
jgi:predicted PurR-regulated permease PerM